MRSIITALAAVMALTTAHAGTLTITASGFSSLPATAPANWPAGITYPASQSPNGTKTFTISDADWQQLITWAASATITPNTATPPTPTAGQILLNWVNIWATGTKQAIQQYNAVPASVPPAINMQ